LLRFARNDAIVYTIALSMLVGPSIAPLPRIIGSPHASRSNPSLSVGS
jgi:hypothetical protein